MTTRSTLFSRMKSKMKSRSSEMFSSSIKRLSFGNARSNSLGNCCSLSAFGVTTR